MQSRPSQVWSVFIEMRKMNLLDALNEVRKLNC